MTNLLTLFCLFVVNLSDSAFGFGPYRVSRRQIGTSLGNIVFPNDEVTTPRKIVHNVVSNLPQNLQNLLDITQEDLDYFEVEPFDDRFGQKPKENKCKVGRQQSPIDIDTFNTVWKEYPPLHMNGHWNFKHKVLLFNEGHTIMLKEKGGVNRPKITGGPLREQYTFEQLHFHWGPNPSMGSEHTINGQTYAAEAHMVHYQSRYGSYKKAKENKGLLVLGYIFQVSDHFNEELRDFIDPIPLVSRFKNVTFSAPDILKLFKKASNACYYTYTGSLTTGDCAEGVLWILFNQTIPISPQQLSQFRKMYGSNGDTLRSNFRETQRLNGRQVEFVTSDSSKSQGLQGGHSNRQNLMRHDDEDYTTRPMSQRSNYGRY
ncbi:hypothetical protein M8J77_002648 [Diaphorina citri]|nr:hypothetical protein M8J77_002648 [Diaphorina citri]